MFTFIQIQLLQVWQTALIALRALRRNKMRSMLTALGIIIGVASVVAMVAVGVTGSSTPSTCSTASGSGTWLSMATSAKSWMFFFDGCRRRAEPVQGVGRNIAGYAILQFLHFSGKLGA